VSLFAISRISASARSASAIDHVSNSVVLPGVMSCSATRTSSIASARAFSPRGLVVGRWNTELVGRSSRSPNRLVRSHDIT